MNFLRSFFEESPGVGSMTRLVLFLAFCLCIALPTTVWAILSWQADKLLPIDSTVSTFCMIGFGAASGAKVVQSIGAEKTPNNQGGQPQ